MEKDLAIGSRIIHKDFGKGVIVNIKASAYIIVFIDQGQKEIPKSTDLEIIESVEADTDLVSLFDVERSLTSILKKWTDLGENVPLGTKWTGGKMILKPGDDRLASKEIPVETFFSKIVMIRDRMRTLEQRVNASNLSAEEKINIQQYITKCYGTLTSFNLLFKRTEDHFTGEKSQD